MDRRIAAYAWIRGAAIGVALSSACVREPEPEICPLLSEGELVITEIRGDNGPDQVLGQWIELYNASGSDLELRGLILDIVESDGGRGRVRVRSGLVSAPEAYVVLGLHGPEPADVPTFVDYSVFGDWFSEPPGGAVGGQNAPRTLSESGRGSLELYACGELVDRVRFELPPAGTLALSGERVPAADRNDDPLTWCTDDHPAGPGELEHGQFGLPGTPGRANPSCAAPP